MKLRTIRHRQHTPIARAARLFHAVLAAPLNPAEPPSWQLQRLGQVMSKGRLCLGQFMTCRRVGSHEGHLKRAKARLARRRDRDAAYGL